MSQKSTDASSPGVPRVVASRLRLLIRDSVAFISALFLGTLLLVVYFGRLLIDEGSLRQDLGSQFLPPQISDRGWEYLLGTDMLGRTVLSRIIVAGAHTLNITLAVVILAAVLGSVIGLIAGFRGGYLDSLAMRLSDVILSFPTLMLAIIFLYIFGPSLINLTLVLAVSRLPLFIRVVRAETLGLRERLFVDAARCLGVSRYRICKEDIAPLVAPTILTLAALEVASVILLESSLSFLGIGVQPPDSSWGLLVAEGRDHLIEAWWLSFFPGLLIFLLALCCNLLANWLRIAADPTQRWRLELSRADRKLWGGKRAH